MIDIYHHDFTGINIVSYGANNTMVIAQFAYRYIQSKPGGDSGLGKSHSKN